MTPGAYLNKRREAAGVELSTIRDVDLAAIEANQVELTIRDAIRLELHFDFDQAVLRDLVAGVEVEVCRGCGCSQWDPCVPDSCHWIEPDLCSACQDQDLAA